MLEEDLGGFLAVLVASELAERRALLMPAVFGKPGIDEAKLL